MISIDHEYLPIKLLRYFFAGMLLIALCFAITWFNSTSYENVVFDQVARSTEKACFAGYIHCEEYERNAVTINGEKIFVAESIVSDLEVDTQYRVIIRGFKSTFTTRIIVDAEPR